jgi:hypothetical protein
MRGLLALASQHCTSSSPAVPLLLSQIRSDDKSVSTPDTESTSPTGSKPLSNRECTQHKLVESSAARGPTHGIEAYRGKKLLRPKNDNVEVFLQFEDCNVYDPYVDSDLYVNAQVQSDCKCHLEPTEWTRAHCQ